MNRRAFITAVSASAALPVVAVASAVARREGSAPKPAVIKGKVYDLVFVNTLEERAPVFSDDSGFTQYGADLGLRVLNAADASGRYSINIPEWKGLHTGIITQLTYRARRGGIDDYHFSFEEINNLGRPSSLQTSFSPVES